MSIMLDDTSVSATHNNLSPLCADYRLILCKQDMKTAHIWAKILQFESVCSLFDLISCNCTGL